MLVTLVLAGIGLFLLRQKLLAKSIRSQVTPEENVTPIASQPPASTPTPAPVVNKSDWSLEVSNGSGITGLAKKYGDLVFAAGYTVVKTGNADKSNYDSTQILVKKELKEKVDLLITDLKSVIKIATVSGELKEGTASARIIIGKDLAI